MTRPDGAKWKLGFRFGRRPPSKRITTSYAMTKIVAVAAVGQNGVIGLNGSIPWPHQEADFPLFQEATLGGAIIIGARALASLPKRLDIGDRTLWTWVGYKEGHEGPIALIERVARCDPGRTIFICGGAATYAAFAKVTNELIVTRVNYNGPGDALFPWEAFASAPLRTKPSAAASISAGG